VPLQSRRPVLVSVLQVLADPGWRAEEGKRTNLTSVLPETKERIQSVSYSEIRPEQKEDEEEEEQDEEEEDKARYPITPRVTIETATVDGHSIRDDKEFNEDLDAEVFGEAHAPGKLSRPSERLILVVSRTMLRVSSFVREIRIPSDELTGVLPILGAVINELESLIDRLDLETAPDMTPPKTASLSSIFGSEKWGISPNGSRLKANKG
jgi:hypothetical protein